MEAKRFISWVEIPAENFQRCIRFYNKVFGLDLNTMDYGDEMMACFPSGEGAIIHAPGYRPSADGVLVSLNAGKELDYILKKIEDSGGVVRQPKTKIQAEGKGYFAIFTDSEGNRMGLYGDE